jgi:hypothetical protein
LRAEQDSISKQSKSNPIKFWTYIKTKTRSSDSIGDIKYVQVDGSECLAKTDEEKANVFCNYFSSVYVVENNVPFDTLQTNETLSSMPDISFDCVDIASRSKKPNINKSEGPD